jgi:hypothetical protein
LPAAKAQEQGVTSLGRGQLVTVDGVGKRVGERSVVLGQTVRPA